ncbi:MAG: hypothetical protein KGN16_16670 [Burkholderiales bacterium]|nr:hypothetical protein [Burkholderiales bacterium]
MSWAIVNAFSQRVGHRRRGITSIAGAARAFDPKPDAMIFRVCNQDHGMSRVLLQKDRFIGFEICTTHCFYAKNAKWPNVCLRSYDLATPLAKAHST